MPWPSSTTSITTETIVNSGAIEMSIPPPRIAGVYAIAASAGVASAATVTIHELQYRKLCCTATLATSSATASTAGSSQARSAARHPWLGGAGEGGGGGGVGGGGRGGRGRRGGRGEPPGLRIRGRCGLRRLRGVLGRGGAKELAD